MTPLSRKLRELALIILGLVLLGYGLLYLNGIFENIHSFWVFLVILMPLPHFGVMLGLFFLARKSAVISGVILIVTAVSNAFVHFDPFGTINHLYAVVPVRLFADFFSSNSISVEAPKTTAIILSLATLSSGILLILAKTNKPRLEKGAQKIEIAV
jgi:hypothetical protein